VKVYISFSTMSVVSPIPRANSSVTSKMGSRSSSKPYRSKMAALSRSTRCHRWISSGRMSRVPRTQVIMKHLEGWNPKAGIV